MARSANGKLLNRAGKEVESARDLETERPWLNEIAALDGERLCRICECRVPVEQLTEHDDICPLCLMLMTTEPTLHQKLFDRPRRKTEKALKEAFRRGQRCEECGQKIHFDIAVFKYSRKQERFYMKGVCYSCNNKKETDRARDYNRRNVQQTRRRVNQWWEDNKDSYNPIKRKRRAERHAAKATAIRLENERLEPFGQRICEGECGEIQALDKGHFHVQLGKYFTYVCKKCRNRDKVAAARLKRFSAMMEAST